MKFSFTALLYKVRFLPFLVPAAALAQQPFSPDTYSGWGTATVATGSFAVVPAAPGVTFSQMVRGAGNGFSSAPDGINASKWNSPSAAAAVADNRYITFSGRAGSQAGFGIDSVRLIVRRSSAGPDSCMLQYMAPSTGYQFVPFSQTVYAVPVADANTELAAIPAVAVNVPPTDSIVFRVVAWHASTQLGTFRIVDQTRISGATVTSAIPPSIQAPSAISGAPFCVSPSRGDSIRVTFVSTGAFNAGNVYTLELSDPTGGFASPLPLGTYAGTANTGHITAFIPAGTSPGTYRLRIRSGSPAVNGTDTATIRIRPGIGITATVTQPPCHNGTGAIDLGISGGTAPFVYQWSNNAVTQDVAGLAPGNYTHTTADTYGCRADTSFTIDDVPAVTVSETTVHVTCHGGNDGSVTLAVSGGHAPYTYQWSVPSAGTPVAGQLTAGTYHVQITDASGCHTIVTAEVTEPAALSVLADVTDVSCHGGHNGSASVSVSGGTAPYTYLWSGTGGTAPSAAGLAAGTHTVGVTDAAGCTRAFPVTVTQPAASALAVQTTPSPCNTCPGGELTVTASGGTPPYTYLWNGGPSGPVFSGLLPGTYCVTATDANGCETDGCYAVASAAGIQNAAVTEIQVFPNPSGGQTVLGCRLPAAVTTAYIQLTDMGGKTWGSLSLSASGDGLFSMDVSMLPGGVYGYTVFSENTRLASGKLIIAR